MALGTQESKCVNKLGRIVKLEAHDHDLVKITVDFDNKAHEFFARWQEIGLFCVGSQVRMTLEVI